MTDRQKLLAAILAAIPALLLACSVWVQLDPTQYATGDVDWAVSLYPTASLLARSVTKARVTATPVGGGDAITATEACATGCVVTVALPDTLYDLYHQWLTAADVVVATSKTRTIAVPHGATP